MVLCAKNADQTAFELLRPHKDSAIGERVTLVGGVFGEAGLTQEFLPVLNPKKKIEGKLLEHLMTDTDCVSTFNGIKMTTASGLVTAKTLASSKID